MNPADRSGDRWTSADSYDLFMGRWSRALADVFVRWLDIPPERRWLEVGCGTGSLTSAICRLARPASVVAVEPSEAFVDNARASVTGCPVDFVVGGAGNLPQREAGYDVVVSSLVLNFLPDPVGAIREMHDAAAARGTVAACVWDYAGGMEILRRFWDAAIAEDPEAAQLDEGRRFPICSRDALSSAFREAGLADVEVEGLTIETHFRDFDDYWQPFLGATGPAPSYVARLSVSRRDALAQRLSAALPRESDGSIRLTAGGWAVRGRERTGL